MYIDGGIGSGCDVGILWMKSTDDNWYQISLTGTSASAAISVNQTPLAWTDNSLGYQLLRASDAKVYQVFLSGSAGDVTMSIQQNSQSNDYDYKPHLLMKSITDGYFYAVSASVSASVVSLVVNQNSKVWLNV